jgi:hypothetical protein
MAMRLHQRGGEVCRKRGARARVLGTAENKAPENRTGPRAFRVSQGALQQLCMPLARRRAVDRLTHHAFTRKAWPPRALHPRPGAGLTGRTVQLLMFSDRARRPVSDRFTSASADALADCSDRRVYGVYGCLNSRCLNSLNSGCLNSLNSGYLNSPVVSSWVFPSVAPWTMFVRTGRGSGLSLAARR